MLSDSLYLALSNECLKGFIQFIEPKIFIEKADVLFYKLKKI